MFLCLLYKTLFNKRNRIVQFDVQVTVHRDKFDVQVTVQRDKFL